MTTSGGLAGGVALEHSFRVQISAPMHGMVLCIPLTHPPHPHPALSGQRQEDHCSLLAPGSEKTLPTPPTPTKKKKGRIERTGYPALVSKCTSSPQEQTPPQTPRHVLPWPAPQLVYITQLQQRDAKLRAKYKFMFLPFSFLFYFWVFFILFYFETGFHYVALTVLELLVIHTDLELRAILLPLTL